MGPYKMRESTTIAIRPLDVLVLCKLLILKDNYKSVSQTELAYELGISQPSISQSISRLMKSRLINHAGDVILDAAGEFILAGIKYMLPAEPGPITIGMPTAHAGPGISGHFRYEPAETYIWPDPKGEVRGHSIPPLYKSVIRAAKKDLKLYEMLALIDMLRVGRNREVRYAKEALSKLIGLTK